MSWPLTVLALLVVATISLYAALTAKRSYAWLFFGLTFAMVVFDKLDNPAIALDRFVQTRILETVAGTLACVAVSLFSTATLRRRWPAVRTPPAVSLGWHADAFRHALQGAIAVALLAVLAHWVRVPALAQSAVTIMAVMLVPVTGIGPSGLGPVSRRLLHRFLGCIAGAALAAIFLFAAQGWAPILIAGTLLGVALGRHLENGDHPYRYVGTQFVLVILVTLVPDSYADAEILPGFERLGSILIGMAILEPVLLVWHLATPGRRRSGAGERIEGSRDL